MRESLRQDRKTVTADVLSPEVFENPLEALAKRIFGLERLLGTYQTEKGETRRNIGALLESMVARAIQNPATLKNPELGPDMVAMHHVVQKVHGLWQKRPSLGEKAFVVSLRDALAPVFEGRSGGGLEVLPDQEVIADANNIVGTIAREKFLSSLYEASADQAIALAAVSPHAKVNDLDSLISRSDIVKAVKPYTKAHKRVITEALLAYESLKVSDKKLAKVEKTELEQALSQDVTVTQIPTPPTSMDQHMVSVQLKAAEKLTGKKPDPSLPHAEAARQLLSDPVTQAVLSKVTPALLQEAALRRASLEQKRAILQAVFKTGRYRHIAGAVHDVRVAESDLHGAFALLRVDAVRHRRFGEIRRRQVARLEKESPENNITLQGTGEGSKKIYDTWVTLPREMAVRASERFDNAGYAVAGAARPYYAMAAVWNRFADATGERLGKIVDRTREGIRRRKEDLSYKLEERRSRRAEEKARKQAERQALEVASAVQPVIAEEVAVAEASSLEDLTREIARAERLYEEDLRALALEERAQEVVIAPKPSVEEVRVEEVVPEEVVTVEQPVEAPTYAEVPVEEAVWTREQEFVSLEKEMNMKAIETLKRAYMGAHMNLKRKLKDFPDDAVLQKHDRIADTVEEQLSDGYIEAGGLRAALTPMHWEEDESGNMVNKANKEHFQFMYQILMDPYDPENKLTKEERERFEDYAGIIAMRNAFV